MSVKINKDKYSVTTSDNVKHIFKTYSTAEEFARINKSEVKVEH